MKRCDYYFFSRFFVLATLLVLPLLLCSASNASATTAYEPIETGLGRARFGLRQLPLGGRVIMAGSDSARLVLRTVTPRALAEVEVLVVEAVLKAVADAPALEAVTLSAVRSLRRDGLYEIRFGQPLTAASQHALSAALEASPEVVQGYPVLRRAGGVAYTDQHLVLRAAPGQLERSLAKALPLLDARLVRRARVRDTALVTVGARFAHDAIEAARWLAARGDELALVSAEPLLYRELRTAATVDDPLYPQQWHLHRPVSGIPGDGQIYIEEAWDITKGDPQVVIAVLDTGTDITHEDLVQNIVRGFDASTGDDDPSAECSPLYDGAGETSSCPMDMPYRESHGTAVSGVAAGRGDNGVGVSGVCPSCSLMPVRLLGYEETTADLSAAEAFVRAVDDGAWVLNNSWGSGYSRYFPLSSVEREALRYARYEGRDGLGAVVLFASGNDTSDVATDSYGRDINVLAVAASTNLDDWAYYSNYGLEIDVAAPSIGGAVAEDEHGLYTSDYMGSDGYEREDYYADFGGTSAASPVAAGLAGLIFSANPGLTADQVRVILMSTADKIRADVVPWEQVFDQDLEELFEYDPDGHSIAFGWGRVNAARAVAKALNPSIQGASCGAPTCASCDVETNRCRLRCKHQDDCPDGTLCRGTICQEREPAPTDVGEPCVTDCFACISALDSSFEETSLCTAQCFEEEDCPTGFVCRRVDEEGTRLCALGNNARGTAATSSFFSCFDDLIFAAVVVAGSDGQLYCSDSCFEDEPGACPYGFHCGEANCECTNERNGWCRQYTCSESLFPGMDNWYQRQCFPDPGFGVTCEDDDLCKVGDYCPPEGLCHVDDRDGCVACARCESDEDCGVNARCRDLNDDDMPRCAPYCASDDTCPGDAVCREVEERFGVVKYCLSPGPGPGGEICDPGYTCQVPCRDDIPCAEGEVCEEGACVQAPPPPPPPVDEDQPIEAGESLAGGGGFAGCSATGARPTASALAGVLLLLSAVRRARRARSTRP